jgi:hypothetical protein
LNTLLPKRKSTPRKKKGASVKECAFFVYNDYNHHKNSDRSKKMQAGDIISYRDMCNAEDVETLQRGMNYQLNPTHSVVLMSRRSNSPYDDEVTDDGRTLIYEGHDVPNTQDIDDPKTINQPMHTRTGKLTQNGMFYEAARAYQLGERSAEVVRVYEKLQSGIWVYNGEFTLVDANLASANGRKVFKFTLQAIDEERLNHQSHQSTLAHTRMIPSKVKQEVFKRDKGQCVLCGSTENLHYDHILPYSKGGTSLSATNIQLLCMTCNLAKSNKIE